MGQSPLQCEAKPGTPRDLFSQQLSIYQWRADPNHNSCVARVFFKNAYTQKQEQKFAEFLQQQQQEDYLELYRFKQEVEDFRKLSSEEVIVFEKYVCHVGHLSSLPLEDSLYLLQTLLCGFQELRKIFDRIVVQENCCFVTHEGEVRVWINPNPKSNQIWAGTDDQLPRQVNIRTILGKIVTIAQRTSLPSPKSDQFFRIISNMLSPSFKHCYYADLRRVINQFCYLNNIQMSKNLHHLLRRTPTQTEYRRSYKRDQRNTETSNPSVRGKLIYLPTAQSESNLHLNKSLLLKSKSLQNQSQGPLIRQSTLLRQTSDYPMPHTLPTVSQIVQCQRPVQPRQSNSQCPQMVRNSGIIKTSVLKASRDFKKSSFLENQILEVDSKSSHNKQASSKHHQPPQQLLQVATNIQAKRTSKTEKNKKARQTASKEMLVSIMQNLPKNSQNFPPGSHMQHHRTHMDRYSTESKQEDMYWSRPWITTKTITKLISEHDQSLQNSIAESSDYYNDSVYSGALTHMGRDITPPNADRSKTVRISRDR